ncbi:GH3 auxin-responsive promoter family protein, partial [Pseudopedobacter sp.]|uniref:GH3 family domain-containing protein n=1 Tax=Pseudopedobacter sp. TaxID=1936787 RepID=UPI0033421AC7
MGIKSFLSKPIAAWIVRGVNRWKYNAVEAQRQTLNHLVKQAKNTVYGRDHHFESIKS